MTSFYGLAGDQAIAMSAATSNKCPHNQFWFRWFQQVSTQPLLFRGVQGVGQMATQQPRDTAWLKPATHNETQTQVNKRTEAGSGQKTWGEQQHQKCRREHSHNQSCLWSPASPLPDLSVKARHPTQCLKPPHASRTSLPHSLSVRKPVSCLLHRKI